jgi:adenylate cyclase
VTEETRSAAGDLAFLEADLVQVVGRSKPLALYVLLGDAAHAATPAFADLASAHRGLIEAYRGCCWDAAQKALDELRERAPATLAGLYDVYAERIAALRSEPPPADWDGVFVARRK